MSRWKYKTETVTVGDNSQEVRGLTAGERRKFAEASKEIKEGKRLATDLPAMVAGFGCINPPVSAEDAESMPSDMLDAVVSKIMALSGMKTDEKKAPTLADDLPPFPALPKTGEAFQAADEVPDPARPPDQPPTS